MMHRRPAEFNTILARARAATATFVRLAEGADASIRGAAIQGLENLGDEQCIPLLMRLIKNPKQDSDRGAEGVLKKWQSQQKKK